MESESIVLLENHNSLLPLSKSLGSIALIGPQVNRVTVRTLLLFVQTAQMNVFRVLVWRLRFLQCLSERHLSSRRLSTTPLQHFCQSQFCARLRALVQ